MPSSPTFGHRLIPVIESLEGRMLLHGGGQLDNVFGTGGLVTVSSSAQNAQITDLAVMSDGRYVMTGTSTAVSGGNQLNVRRFNADGSPDTTFGSGGAATSVIGGNAQVFGAAMQSDNKIVVVGSTGTQYFLLRYLTNGKHDKVFGNGGLVTLTFNANVSVARDVVVNDDGTIVIAGEATLANGSRAVGLAKFQSTGLLDQSFGSTGTLLTKFSIPVNNIDSLFVTRMTEASGSYVISGRYFNGALTPTAGDDAIAIMRVTGGGAPDATFSNDGLSIADEGFFGESATGVAVDSQNRVVVSLAGVNVFGVFRVLSNGRRDTSFGSSGIARVTNSTGTTNDVVIDEDQRIAVAGLVGTLPRLGRLNSNGTVDTEFGASGITSPPVPFASQAAMNRLVESPDHTYLVGGVGKSNQTTGRILSMSKYLAQNEPVGTLSAKNLTAPQTSSYVFSITWNDPDGIDTSTLASGNVRVTGPNSYARNAVLVSIDTSQGPASVTAKYKVAAPDSGWGSEDNGTYSVIVIANQVADLEGEFAQAGTLGTFQVSIT